jgi:DNA-binding transcriptional MerR regulator
VAETIEGIPDRESFKPSEVCEIAGVQPYVLRSWEQEFPRLGVARAPGAPRTYRRADVELALRIKHLVFSEGLTLSGARRRIDAESTPELPVTPAGPAVNEQTRERLASIKKELRALHDLLSDTPRAKGGKRPSTQPELPDLGDEAGGSWPAPKPAEGAATKAPGRKRAASRSR